MSGNRAEDQWNAAAKVVSVLQEQGFEAFFIGGAVRDMLLGYEPKDFDVVTNATPDQVTAIPAFTKASFTDPAQAFGVTRVKITLHGYVHTIEVTTYRRDVEAHLGRKLTRVKFSHIEDDLERRDFTINAMAYDPHAHFLVDLHGGLDDLGNGLVRFIGDPSTRIAEDPLRILRAVRFKNQLGFAYEGQTWQGLRDASQAGKVRDIAIERLTHELTRMLTHKSRRKSVEDLHALGILDDILPELTACIGVHQPADHHSEGDVWEHSLRTIDALPAHPSVRLVWAALLHDIGKAITASKPKDEHDRIHFDNHYRAGAELAQKLLTRLRFSKPLIADITWLIHYHLITDSFEDMKPSRRLHYMEHRAFHDLLELHRADVRGSQPADLKHDIREAALADLDKRLLKYQADSEQPRQTIKQALGIDGNWLINTFNIKDKQLIGAVLSVLQEEFADGTITSRNEAIKLVKAQLAKRINH